MQALSVTQMQIGPQIDPGVPWCYATFGPATRDINAAAKAIATPGAGLHLALKSGNFGTDDFFSKAFELLP